MRPLILGCFCGLALLSLLAGLVPAQVPPCDRIGAPCAGWSCRAVAATTVADPCTGVSIYYDMDQCWQWEPASFIPGGPPGSFVPTHRVGPLRFPCLFGQSGFSSTQCGDLTAHPVGRPAGCGPLIGTCSSSPYAVPC